MHARQCNKILIKTPCGVKLHVNKQLKRLTAIKRKNNM